LIDRRAERSGILQRPAAFRPRKIYDGSRHIGGADAIAKRAACVFEGSRLIDAHD